jgi:hypothetical protein
MTRTSMEIAMFNAQREAAIRAEKQAKAARFAAKKQHGKMRDQIEKCYRSYCPPQIHELTHGYTHA